MNNFINIIIIRLMNNKNEQNINEQLWKFRKIKSWRKGNYINEDKTEEHHKKKYYNTELETIYSENIDKRYKNLIIDGYSYISNLLRYEFENKSNIIFLEEKIGQSIYLLLLNYILIYNLWSKSKAIKILQKWEIKREQFYDILRIVNIDLKKIKSSNIVDIFLWINISELDEEKRLRLKELIIEELKYVQSNIINNNELILTIKERKNKTWQEISSIILNTYDFLFLIYYITNFFDELSFIFSKNKIGKIKDNFRDYNIIIKEEEFVTIIEIIVIFYLKGYKNYLYKNYNFLWAINDLIVKTKEALEYKKWSPIKSNFKSWLSNWSKNYIKQYIQDNVRPLEEMERMNFIYNQISDVISTNNDNNNTNRNENNSKNIEDIGELRKEDNWNIIDIKEMESYKRQIESNNSNNLKENYNKVTEYMDRLREIYKIKKNIKEIAENSKTINKGIDKKLLIRYFKKILYEIYDYIDESIDYDSIENKVLIDKIIENINILSTQEIYILLINTIEIIVWKKVPKNINITKIINIELLQ